MSADLPLRLQGGLLVFVLALTAGRAWLLWTTHRINPFVLGSGKRGAPRLAELGFVALSTLLIVEIVLISVNAPRQCIPNNLNPRWLDSTAARWLGLTMQSVGIALFGWALVSFGQSWRIGIDSYRPGRLVTGGAFSWSRNPIFVFLDLYVLGAFLVNGTLFFLVVMVVFVAGVHGQILVEERFLGRQYGNEYQEYCRRVRRYFGRRT